MTAAHNAQRFRGARFSARLTLQAAPSAPARVRAIEGVSRLSGGVNARRMRFEAPSDMRGVATLTHEREGGADDLWIFLPSLGRVRRLVSSNRRDPWVGSDFSLGDILGHKVEDWTHALAGSEAIDGVACWKIASAPATPQIARDTGYSRRMSWVRTGDFVLARAEFLDPAGGRAKLMHAEDIRAIEPGKAQPMRITMRNLARGSVSVLSFETFRADAGVREAEVAPEALRV